MSVYDRSDARRTSNYPVNAWTRRQKRKEYPQLAEKCERTWDMTFSLGRPTSHKEIIYLLTASNCIDKAENVLDYVRMIKIGGNMENGQVMVYCRGDYADNYVERISALRIPGTNIKKCHSYTLKEILVRFSFIHPNIDVETVVVKGFLEKHHGKVKDWFAVVDGPSKVPVGPYNFYMSEEDLRNKPLPGAVYFGNQICYITYRTQVRHCSNCNSTDHFVRDCTVDNFPTLGKSAQDASRIRGHNVFAPSPQEHFAIPPSSRVDNPNSLNTSIANSTSSSTSSTTSSHTKPGLKTTFTTTSTSSTANELTFTTSTSSTANELLNSEQNKDNNGLVETPVNKNQASDTADKKTAEKVLAEKPESAPSGVKRKPTDDGALIEPDGKTTKQEVEDIVATAAKISEINVSQGGSVPGYNPVTNIANTQVLNDILPNVKMNENNVADADKKNDWYEVSHQSQLQIEEARNKLIAD